MDEYISREALLAEIAADYGNWIVCNDTDESYRQGVKDNYSDTIRLINDIPAADVQPVNRWISVKDRLPDKFDYVLCYCKTTTGEGNEFMFGAYHNDTWWLKTCRTYATLEQPQMRVMYWMPLPEPPKDGDTSE